MQSAAILSRAIGSWRRCLSRIWKRWGNSRVFSPLNTWRKSVPGRKTGHFKALRWAHTWYVGGRKGDEYGYRGVHRSGESERKWDQRWNENKSCKSLQTVEGHAFYSKRSRAIEGFWAEEWLDSPDLPLIDHFAFLSEQTGESRWRSREGCWENDGGGSDEVRAVGTGMWDERVRGQVLSIFWSGANRTCWKCGPWCERKRGAEADSKAVGLLGGRNLQLGWKIAGRARLREKIRSSVLGKLGLRCLWKYQVLSLDVGKLSGLEV